LAGSSLEHDFAFDRDRAKLRRMPDHDYDVAVVGASLAGCAAARLLARAGLSVALIEKSPDPSAYKTICTHYIQPSATPAIERLGLAPLIEEAGAVRNAMDLWTRYGWIYHPSDADYPHGYNIRRERLDPIVRGLASRTEGVTPVLGRTVRGLVERGGRIGGVVCAGSDGAEEEITARLVVGADGRTSKVADLGEVPARTWPNRRFAHMAYYRGLELASGQASQLWFLDPRVAYAFPNDDGVTLVVFWAMQKERDGVKGDIEGFVTSQIAKLQDGPRLEEGERISPWLGKVDMPNVYRRAAHRGMALIGDAALAADPVWGVGCGWAFQSAEWLAESAGPALARGGDVDGALEAYRRRHRRELLLHHVMISEYSRGRRFRMVEKLMFAAGARNPALARHLHSYAARIITVPQFLSPTVPPRAAATLLRRRPLTERPRRAAEASPDAGRRRDRVGAP
jgi:2-polyprenyl-6-methoxyphenol hydroxylase-like FAD-dependent oxidoreductase